MICMYLSRISRKRAFRVQKIKKIWFVKGARPGSAPLDPPLIAYPDSLIVFAELPSWLLFAFASKIFGDGRNLQMVLCNSMAAG